MWFSRRRLHVHETIICKLRFMRYVLKSIFAFIYHIHHYEWLKSDVCWTFFSKRREKKRKRKSEMCNIYKRWIVADLRTRYVDRIAFFSKLTSRLFSEEKITIKHKKKPNLYKRQSTLWFLYRKLYLHETIICELRFMRYMLNSALISIYYHDDFDCVIVFFALKVIFASSIFLFSLFVKYTAID